MTLETIRKLKYSALLTGSIMGIFMMYQIYMAGFSTNDNSGYTYSEQNFLNFDTYITYSNEFDSIMGDNQKNEILFVNQGYDLKTNSNIRHFDLDAPEISKIRYIYVIYYLLMLNLWAIMIFHIYRYIHSFNQDKLYTLENVNGIKRLFLLFSIFSTYIFVGNISMNWVIIWLTDEYIHFTPNFSFFIIVVLCAMISILLQIIARYFNNGYRMSLEQDLTV